MKQQQTASQTVTTAGACALTGYSEARLRQLVGDGYFPRAVRGQYQLEPLIRGVLKHKDDVAERASIAHAEGGLRQSKQREIDLRIAQKMGDLVDFSDVTAAIGQILSGFRAELDGVPAAVTRDRTVRAAVQKGLETALTRCEGRFREAGEALRAGRDPFEGDAEIA